MSPSIFHQVTGIEFVPSTFSSDKSVDAETQAILDTVSKKKNRSKKKKKAGAGAASAGEAKAMDDA